MRDLSGPLAECLKAVEEKRNLQQILRRYPADRDELIGMLRLSLDLNGLGAPAADPAFRLRARNRMLAVAAQRRHERGRTPLAILPRPVLRLALAGAFAVALAVGGLTAAAASQSSLPGDPLYGVKLGAERLQLAVTLDSASRARLQLHFADVRLDEAQRLFSLGRPQEAVRLVNQYDAAVAQFNRSLASSALDSSALNDLSQLVQDRQQQQDARLNALAASLNAHGDTEAAASVNRAQAHADEALKGSQRDMQAHETHNPGPQASHAAKPAGDQH
ncbi:MAG TPA: DUF5667 domain-containing protein [Candidatus Dormibacteraeota bacterium]|nr:DUF5667 domain-containing protein [Candidatus Dormibacteraeota bacterium]